MRARTTTRRTARRGTAAAWLLAVLTIAAAPSTGTPVDDVPVPRPDTGTGPVVDRADAILDTPAAYVDCTTPVAPAVGLRRDLRALADDAAAELSGESGRIELTPFGITPCPGVRPGGSVTIVGGGTCTLNFVWDGRVRTSSGAIVSAGTYIGTAGHCATDPGTERVWSGNGPVALGRDGNRIGTVVYANDTDPRDFALIRLDSGVTFSAEMCHFGGPTGTNTSTSTGATVLHHYGHGLGTYQTLPARTAVATGLPDPDTAFAAGAQSLGDSGAPVISSDGRAVGVAVTVGVTVRGTEAGTIGITRIAPQLERARQRLGLVSLDLRTAPLR
ncbi:MAG: trypsin-like serine protease [Actinomycetes bacterium]